MIELDIENKLKENLSQILNGDDCEIVGSWSPVNIGYVKGENLSESKCMVSLYVQPRQHDNFSLPTINLTCGIVMDFRVEQCPTMAEVSQVYDKVLSYFDELHFNALKFSEDYSTSDFYATELMLNGGDKVTYDRDRQCWVVSMMMTIRGSVNR